jgi:glucose/arabinose dehydrogenase
MRIGPQRPVNPEAIQVPDGYRAEAVVTGLSFPSALSFGPGGELYLSERGGVAGMPVSVPRVLRIDPDGSVNEIGRLDNPIVGVVYRSGELFIAEDGDAPRILRVTAEGELKILVDGLPGGGDHGLAGLALDRNGNLLFALGTRTNSGVVGLDNVARGWVARNPDWADTLGADVELAGVNYATSQPTARGQARATTGSLKPFGHRCEPGETARGSALCGGAVYRMALDSQEPERIAWGLRCSLGVAGGSDGRVWATEAGMEERGSRPIGAVPDCLWDLPANGYLGWPDYAAGVPVTDPRYRLPGHPQPRRLLARGPKVIGTPVATFPARSGAAGVALSLSEAFGFAGDLFVALSGPWSLPAYPEEGGAPGHRVVRVNPRNGEVSDFLLNRQAGPASAHNGGGLERPFDVRFDPAGEALYVVDLGEVQVSRENGLEPYGGTGVIWRITRLNRLVSLPPRAADQAPGEGDFDAETDAPEGEWSAEESAPESPDELAEGPGGLDEFDLGALSDMPAEPDADDEPDDDPDAADEPDEVPEPDAPAAGEEPTPADEPADEPAGDEDPETTAASRVADEEQA